MGPAARRKPLYNIDEVASQLDLNFVDLGALVVEQEVRFCTAVAALPVELGFWEEGGPTGSYRVADDYRHLTGLADLRPQDALAVLRQGQTTLQWLDAELPRYIRIGGADAAHGGIEVHRYEIGIRPPDMLKLRRVYGPEAETSTAPAAGRPRGAQPVHDWRLLEREAARRCFFEGVPESKNALVRHLQAWCADQGRPVPDDSTLKRELKEFWDIYGPEAQRRSA